MPKPINPFIWLSAQFETLAAELTTCEDAGVRKHLLRKMKMVIDEVDSLIDKDQPSPDSIQHRNAAD
jgi:hypothetical protein